MNYNDYYYPLSHSGDIIFCNFPNRNDLDTEYHGTPYIDPPHYCLVLASDEDSDSILVMYGTSKVEKYRSEKGLLLSEHLLSGTGLNRDTKFIFDQESIALIPFSKQYINKKNGNIKVGVLPTSKYNELKKLLSNEGFHLYKEKLAENCDIMISKKTKKYF